MRTSRPRGLRGILPSGGIRPTTAGKAIEQDAGDKGSKGRAKVAGKLRDGTKLCNAYQRGQCRNTNCKFTHKCGRVNKQGKVCGQRHTARDHDKATKTK